MKQLRWMWYMFQCWLLERRLRCGTARKKDTKSAQTKLIGFARNNSLKKVVSIWNRGKKND